MRCPGGVQNKVVDVNLGYSLRAIPGALVTLTITNLFDDDHLEFVGAPEIGRLAMLRFQYQLP